MKRMMSMTVAALTAVSLAGVDAHAGVRLAPSMNHFGTGLGICINKVPVAMSEMKLPISHFYYERQFTDPTNFLHTGVEIGLHGAYIISPVPEMSANVYLGSEESVIQGKIGIGAMYDVLISGHAGVTVRAGMVINNRFEIGAIVVPTGKNQEKTYEEVFGIKGGTKDVSMPYGGLVFCVRY